MKRVLVAPLDWGLGHATRCIPIIQELQHQQCEVVLAGSGGSLNLLRAEFPALLSFELSGYNPVYPASGSMVWSMAGQLLKFKKVIQREHQELEQIVQEQHIDLVISDNRYGCWSSQVRSIFITHQSNILMPKRFGWLAPIVRAVNIRLMAKFSCCWIPDRQDEQSLAGKLNLFRAVKIPCAVEFIGSLTRFKPSPFAEKKYDVVAVFSGPEPQRSMVDKLVTRQLQESGLHYRIVRGIPPQTTNMNMTAESSQEVNFLIGKQLQELLEQAHIVIARSGYSTIMDLAALKSKAIFIPTPGQTEQEYLAKRLKEKGIAFFMSQHEFDLRKALEEAKHYSGFMMENDGGNFLRAAIEKFVKPK